MSHSPEDAVSAILAQDELILMTHEHPDGDAIGSLSALHRMLVSIGRSPTMLITEGDDPADEYRFLVSWDDVVRELPDGSSGATLVLLDCGNYERSPIGSLDPSGFKVVNIDHHHDNTRFGDVNVVDPEASCTAELVWRMAPLMKAPIDALTAQALYAGLITDTGRFMYSNTGTQAHAMAADLIDRGVDVEAMYRRIYEGVDEGKVRLLGAALSKLQRFDGGTLSVTFLNREDFDGANAADEWTEGIVDHLRAIQGTAVAAVVREPEGSPDIRRVSLRASMSGIDVSVIARGGGGGGHKGAAGFSTDLGEAELIEFLRAAVSAQMAASANS